MISLGNHANDTDGVSAMDVDPFLAFIDYARSVISPADDDSDPNGNCSGPGWSWIASRILKTCVAYSSGVTAAILLSDLSQVSLFCNLFLCRRKIIKNICIYARDKKIKSEVLNFIFVAFLSHFEGLERAMQGWSS